MLYIPTETVEKSVDNSIQVVDNLGRTMMKVKPNKKKISGGSKTKQIVSIVKYLSDIASEENISVRPLWLDPIPGYIFVDEIEIAKPIPVLPNTVDVEYVKPAIKDIKNIPIGVNKKSLNIASIKLANKVVFPVVAQEIYEAANFTEELIRVLALTTETIVVDVEQLFGEQNFGVSISLQLIRPFLQWLFLTIITLHSMEIITKQTEQQR